MGNISNFLTLTLVFRRSHLRGGTRFYCRGLDDAGNVGNFVETETIVECGQTLWSFVQVRGSLPMFWE